MKTIDDIRSSFENSKFFSYIGFQIVHFEEGDVLLKLPIEKKLHNINDNLHGGVHAAMLDIVQRMVVRSIYKTRISTVNLNVHYLAPIREGDMFAKALILQQGYKTVTAEGLLEDKDGNLIGKGTGTFKIIRD